MDRRPQQTAAALAGQPVYDCPGLSGTGAGGEVTAGWTVEKVYHCYHQRVRSLALRLLGNDSDAEDVVQEVLLQVLRKLHTFRGQARLSTWLHRVTVNAVLLLQRRRGVCREQHLGPRTAGSEGEDEAFACELEASPDYLALRTELRQYIDRAIAELPADSRVVYEAAEVEGLPHAEIADRLGLSLPAVKSRLHRGRMRLRAVLTPYVLER